MKKSSVLFIIAACAAVVLSSCEKEGSDKNPYDKDKGLQAYYWTSQRDEEGDNFAINLSRFRNLPSWNTQYVCIGSTVRPVCP